MKFEILTIFPELFQGFLDSSLIARAIKGSSLSVVTTDIRSFAELPHMKVDDEPYGGGAGMVLKPEPIAAAIAAAKSRLPDAKVVYLSPAGAPFSQKTAKEASAWGEVILLCGRYEGVDQRVIDLFVDEEWSIGDYVLMGGEVPAMVVIEAITRLCPDVLGNAESIAHESFSENLLEAPHYTRPPSFAEREVPTVLLSGDHKKIAAWRKAESLRLTEQRRPDLLKGNS